MAQILSFRTPEFKAGDATGRRHGISAEVIFFPGVRYERWGEPEAAPSSAERHGSRDVLELAE